MSIIIIALASASYMPALTPRPAVARVRIPIAFVGPEDDSAEVGENIVGTALYRTTENGLSFKDLERGEGDLIASDAMVTLRVQTSIVSTGDIVQRGEFIYQRSEKDLYDEAIKGMRIGGKRRVLVKPSSTFSILEDETVDLEIEATGVVDDKQKLQIRASRAINGVINFAFWYIVADNVLQLLGVLPDSAVTAVTQNVDVANAWAAQGLSQVGLM